MIRVVVVLLLIIVLGAALSYWLLALEVNSYFTRLMLLFIDYSNIYSFKY